MRALTVLPGVAGSAKVTEVDQPPEADGPLLVETVGGRPCVAPTLSPDGVKTVISLAT